MDNTDHMNYLEFVTADDVAQLRKKEATYRGSWKKRGGVGAWMMACRKFDRLEGMLEARNWDIFAAIGGDHSGQDGSALAEVRDLRRYLLLIEAEMVSRGVVKLPPPVVPVPCPSPQKPKPDIRIMDGLSYEDYVKEGVHQLITFDGKETHYIVDRKIEPNSLWVHLPRLAVELNNKEREEMPPEYRGLYKWVNGKWRMDHTFESCWGKEP